MESFDYLGPTGDKVPLGLHQADFERRKLQWMIEEHDATWEPIRTREQELQAAGGERGGIVLLRP